MLYNMGRFQEAQSALIEIIKSDLDIHITYSNMILIFFHLNENASGIQAYFDNLSEHIKSQKDKMDVKQMYEEDIQWTEQRMRSSSDEKFRGFSQTKIEAMKRLLLLLD